MAQTNATAGDRSLVAVVVLNRRGRPHTLACLQSLAAIADPRTAVLLIDNGCEEFSATEVAALIPGGRYRRTERNLGFTGGVNLGIREALAAGADFVFLLNNDTVVEADVLAELVQVAVADARIGVVGAKLLQLDNPKRLEAAGLQVDRRWGRVYQTGFGEADEGQYDGVTDVDAVSGGAMLLRRALCEQVGGFDERYFCYLEDADLCLRARQAGWRVVLAPRARVLHKGKGAAGGQTSPLVLYYATRNHLLLMCEHGTGPAPRRLLRAALIAVRNLVYAVRESGPRAARLRAVCRAVRDYRRGAFGPAPEDAGPA